MKLRTFISASTLALAACSGEKKPDVSVQAHDLMPIQASYDQNKTIVDKGGNYIYGNDTIPVTSFSPEEQTRFKRILDMQ